VTERRAELRRRLSAQHPDLGSPETPISQLADEQRTRLMQLMAEARAGSRAQDTRDVVRELRGIVEPVRA
jgi:hypothetical protein